MLVGLRLPTRYTKTIAESLTLAKERRLRATLRQQIFLMFLPPSLLLPHTRAYQCHDRSYERDI
jgi:hypothetical protein